MMRGGLGPCWVKAIKAGFANSNAKTEGVWVFFSGGKLRSLN